jgi:hypothetical protein
MTGLNAGRIKPSSRLLEQFTGAVCGAIYSMHGVIVCYRLDCFHRMAKMLLIRWPRTGPIRSMDQTSDLTHEIY